jgi:hypothetical protein
LNRAADFFGFVAYLVVTSNGLPDPELLSAAYQGSRDDSLKEREAPRLWAVDTSAESVSEAFADEEPEEGTEIDEAAA